MRMGLLESLRKIIWRDLNTVGSPVGNMHGPAVVKGLPVELGSSQTWLVHSVTGDLPLEPGLLLERLRSGGQTRLELANGGKLSLQALNGVQIIHTSVASTTNTRFSLQLTAEQGGEVVLFVNDQRVRKVQGSSPVVVQVALPPGEHNLLLLAKTSSLEVVAPLTVSFDATKEVLQKPVLNAVATGTHDPVTGASQVTLTWAYAVLVGGYRVLRRPRVLLGTASTSTYDVGSGRLSLLFDDDVSALLQVGDSVFTEQGDLGIVTTVRIEDDDSVSATVSLIPSAVVPAVFTGVEFYKGNYAELGRVRSETGNQGLFVDTTCVFAEEYDYAIQAFGLFDESQLSVLSDAQYIMAGDLNPPGPIEFEPGYPRVANRNVIAKFVTPSDSDYAGVRVFFRTPTIATLNVASVAGSVITTQETGLTVNAYAGKYLRLNSSLVSHRIISNTASTLTMETMPSTPAPINNDDLVIYDQYLVKTDYGLPGTDDEVIFEASDYGTYYFATFDKSGNTQAIASAESWEYDPTDDTFTTAPIVAFRQVTEAEQTVTNFSGYEDRVTYAIYEVYAYDVDGVTRPGTTVYYRVPGGETTNVLLDNVQSGDFPRVVSGATTINTATSRYVAINRTQGRLELWASNAGGYVSDRVTVVADLDDTPEIVSIEGVIDSVQNHVVATIVVDDDCNSVGVVVDGGSPVYYAMTQNSLTLAPLTLNPGQQRQLTVTPYRVHGAPPQEPGSPVTREFIRSPKSFVTTENKNADNDLTAVTVKTSFAMSPAPVARVIASGQTSRTGTVTSNVLTDSGNPAWATNVWAPSGFYVTFARLTYSNGDVEVRQVTSNTADTITLLPEGVGVPDGSVTYQLMDGAVKVGVTEGTLVRTPRPMEVDYRSRSALLVYTFHAVKSGCVPETPRTILVDADTLPSLTGVQYDYDDTVDAERLTVLFETADDDATYWEFYERRSNTSSTTSWPTFTGATPATIANLDPAYLRWAGPVEQNSFARSMVGLANGFRYGVVVVKNSYGEPGPLYTISIDLGTASQSPLLVDVQLGSDLTNDEVDVTFQANAAATGGTAVAIYAYRNDNPAINRTINTTVAASQPHSFDVGEDIIASGGTLRTWTVQATLSGANPITKQIQLRTQPLPDVVEFTSGSHTVFDPGNCADENCFGNGQNNGNYPFQMGIVWAIDLNSNPIQGNSGYTVGIEWAWDVAGTEYVPLVTGLDAADDSYTHSFPCNYSPAGTANTYFRYRIKCYDSLGSVVDTIETTQSTRNIQWCSQGGNPF